MVHYASLNLLVMFVVMWVFSAHTAFQSVS